MTTQVAQDLRAAAEVLRRDGWTQGDLGTCDGPKCAVGAAYYVASDGAEVVYEFCGSDTIRRAEQIADAVAAWIGVDRPDLPTWNDSGKRTADEVIAALEAAADAAEVQA
jgi:hypothetical protein